MTDVSVACILWRMEDMAYRIRAARTAAELTQEQVAIACGVTRNAVSQWESQKPQKKPTTPTLEHLKTLAAITRHNAWWLQTGEGPRYRTMFGRPDQQAPVGTVQDEPAPPPSRNEYTNIPRYKITGSAGQGRYVEHELIGDHLAFRTDWLKSRPYSIKDLTVIHAEGESMEPLIRDGNILLIDCAQRQIKSGKVYALRVGEDVRIKRLFWQTDGSLLISSDNKSPDHRDEVVAPDAVANVHVIGRAVWTGGEI